MKGPRRASERTKRAIWIVVAAGMLLLLPLLHGRASEPGLPDNGGVARAEAVSEPAVRLSAASGQTALFQPNNGRPIGGVEPETYELPLLVLYRNGRLAPPDERALIVDLTAIPVPSPGVTVTLSVTTMHGDPDPGSNHENPFTVWHESRWIPASPAERQETVAVAFTRTFTELVSKESGAVATPTDYFGYDVVVTAAGDSGTGPLGHWNGSYAFLMENQWTAALPGAGIAEGTPAGLKIHYCDMFPFRQDIRQTATWIRRGEVTDFVRDRLVPGIQEVFRTETQGWGFQWQPDWTSYRSDQDGELISVALTDGRTWFHSRAPAKGHAGISVNVNGGRSEYDRFVDGLMSTFYHELFHNVQRNINQHQGGRGDVEGYRRQWSLFSEGTAVLASSVGQSRIQFGAQRGRRAYMAKAAGFLGNEQTLGSDLNVSYRDIPASYLALYWRFLYEHCGGMQDGIEDPAAGMGVIRRTLENLYSTEVIDVSSPADPIEGLRIVMDDALSDLTTTSCPFRTYQESLIAFARAIYSLRLEDGRCREPGSPSGCGFYDPEGLYPRPPADALRYTGAPVTHDEREQLYPAGIPSSYGIDLLQVELVPDVDDQSMTIELHTDPAAAAKLHVELGFLQGDSPEGPAALVGAFQPLSQSEAEGVHSVTIPRIDIGRWNRLALVITRLDSAEAVDPQGAYTLVLRPGGN